MATRRIDLRIVAGADGVDVVFRRVETALRGMAGSGRRAFDPITEAAGRAAGGLGDLRTQLSSLPGLLSGIGVGVTVRGLVQLADSYSQMTARLRLATQYTGNFAEVQAALKEAAEDTRAPLQETADLYSKLAPALNSIGRSGEAGVGIIRTINQSIALSGASASEAQAALLQFGQGLGSGVLRGEELNSVLEQTPALADAIAEGLGVTRAELRRLGEQGQLTGEAVATALERVAGRVDADFRSMPITVGQALTLLRNQLFDIVGSADQGSGAMQELARGIVIVADGIKAFGESGSTLKPFVDFVVDAVDGVSRLFRVVATGLAGYAVAIKQALSGNLTGALETYREIGREVERIVLEPMAADRQRTTAAQDGARARLKVEQDLASAITKLEQLRAVQAGKASADILLDAKQTAAKRIEEGRKATQEELKGTQALRDALRSAWDGAVEGARKARDEAAALLRQAADARTSSADKAVQRRLQGLPEDQRSDAAEREARSLRDEAASSAARATIKAYEGDLAGAKRLAGDAAKQAERAERFADLVTDNDTAANLFEELGQIRAKALEAEARMKEAEAQAQTEQAAAIDQQIQQAEQRITALKAELAKPVTIDADIAQAEQQVKVLQEQLAALQDKTITVTVNRVETGAAPVEGAQPEGSFASGGAVHGPGTGTSDSILARLSNGEYVIRAAAVRRYGVNFLNAVNGMRMPRFATGGLVSSALAPAIAGVTGESAGGTPVVLDFGSLGRYSTSSTPDVAAEIVQTFKRAALQRGRRS